MGDVHACMFGRQEILVYCFHVAGRFLAVGNIMQHLAIWEVRAVTFGVELRQHRAARGWSLRRCAQVMYLSPGYLSKLENDKAAPTVTVAKAADAAFQTGKHFQGYVLDPSEVQCDEELKLTLFPHETSDGRVVFVPTSRRNFLHGLGAATVTALTSSLIVSELENKVDVKPISFFQAAHRTLIDNDNIFGPLEVIPQAQKQIAAIGRVHRMTKGRDRAELIHLQARFGEFCGWLCQDLGDHSVAQYWTDRALDWSYIAGDPELTTFILARKSQLAGDMRDSAMAIGIGEAAAATAPSPRLAAIANVFAAHGHALSGDRVSAEHLYESSRELIAPRPGKDVTWGAWLDESYIGVHRARSLTELGIFKVAAEAFTAAIDGLPSGFHRDRGVYLARAARAHAGAGEVDAAADMGLQSLNIAVETRSGRIATELASLARDLKPINTASVTRLQEAMRDTVILT